MSNRNMKIAVLGAGICGVNCVSMLKEEGFDPICFEKTDQIGGTWCYREESVVGQASLMPTTVINHSKELGAISNFPPSKHYSNYMRHRELYQYIQDYAAEKDVLRHVRFNSEVVGCKRDENYEETGRWSVTVKDTLTGIETSDIYDAVLMSVGFNNRPKMPSFTGQETFKGKIMHTHSLKGVSEFKGQNVVIIGMGCSALDAAVEVAAVAKQVYLSTKSGSHIINRVGPHGYPIDYILLRRYLLSFLDIVPIWLCAWYVRKFYLDPKFDHKLYPVEPKYNFLAKDPAVNDHIGSKLLTGTVVQKKDIVRFTENGVVFDSEEQETKADTVIMATGYEWQYPFLEDGIVVQENSKRINLYKCMWPPHLKHATFAVMTFFLPFGPGHPLTELQCRWAAHILAGKGKLPSTEVMLKEIEQRHTQNVARYGLCDRTSIRVDYVQYMDEIASEIGAKPKFWKMFFTDIRLFLKLWFGPCVSYQYRLEGPHKWAGARDAIMTVDERLHFPLLKEKKRKQAQSSLLEFTLDWLIWIKDYFCRSNELFKKIN